MTETETRPESAASRRRRALRQWAANNLRRFPWRETSDPWEVLMAEVLLRRTRAEQVARIYPEVIAQLPSPLVTSRKRIESVTKLISSAGLSRRAEEIRSMAKTIVEVHDGVTPVEVDELIALPGVGPYVAGAVAAASGTDVLLTDTNTVRVAVRVAGIDPGPGDIRRRSDVQEAVFLLFGGPAEKTLWWAVLDLAASHCTPKRPACSRCPLRDTCAFARARALSDGTGTIPP